MTLLTRAVQSTPVWGGFRVWQRNRDAFIRSWKVEVGGIFIEPWVMLIAIGFGLGAYVSEIDGRSYAQFVAPGVVASYAMWHSVFDSTYGAYIRMETNHLYEAYLFTPLGTEDIVMGEVIWAATRSVVSATAVLVVASIFGLVGSPLAILAIPLAYLIGLMFAAIAMIMTATATTIGAMNNFFTLFMLPMFYVGGVFYPLDRLPETVQKIAWILPLTPATALTRGLVTGQLSVWMLAWTAELVAFGVIAFWLAAFFMRRRLVK
jgi:lipooligosaccharide transport system permease protein